MAFVNEYKATVSRNELRDICHNDGKLLVGDQTDRGILGKQRSDALLTADKSNDFAGKAGSTLVQLFLPDHECIFGANDQQAVCIGSPEEEIS
jgi:hypothetical protein